MIVHNPYSAGIWSKKNIKVDNVKNYHKIQEFILKNDKCIKVLELNQIFRQCLKNNKNKNMKILVSKSIKLYLENITGKEFPNDYLYDFCSLNKTNSRYATITGIKVTNKKTNKCFYHDCNIEDLYSSDINKSIRAIKRLRGTSLLRKIKNL